MSAYLKPNEVATELTRQRYQRISSWYDRMEAMSEKRYTPWRKRIWALLQGQCVLEVGVGTGKNMLYYPAGVHMTAIDLTPGMLERAQVRAADLKLNVDLRLGDAQSLDFPDASFDAAIATFVFCSVPDPVLGLREIRRVVKSNGQVLLLEHMRIKNRLAGSVMDFVNPLVVSLMGANINRRTVENVKESGLFLEKAEDNGMGGMFKMILARVA